MEVIAKMEESENKKICKWKNIDEENKAKEKKRQGRGLGNL